MFLYNVRSVFNSNLTKAPRLWHTDQNWGIMSCNTALRKSWVFLTHVCVCVEICAKIYMKKFIRTLNLRRGGAEVLRGGEVPRLSCFLTLLLVIGHSHLHFQKSSRVFFPCVIPRTDLNTTRNSFAKISPRKRCPWMRTVLGWKKEFKIFICSKRISPRAWGMSTRLLNRAICRRWTRRRKL